MQGSRIRTTFNEALDNHCFDSFQKFQQHKGQLLAYPAELYQWLFQPLSHPFHHNNGATVNHMTLLEYLLQDFTGQPMLAELLATPALKAHIRNNPAPLVQALNRPTVDGGIFLEYLLASEVGKGILQQLLQEVPFAGQLLSQPLLPEQQKELKALMTEAVQIPSAPPVSKEALLFASQHTLPVMSGFSLEV